MIFNPSHDLFVHCETREEFFKNVVLSDNQEKAPCIIFEVIYLLIIFSLMQTLKNSIWLHI